MSDSKKTNEINDKELKQVAGGGGYLFRCPVCNTEMEVQGVGCEVGEVGGHCPNCMNQTGQWIGMIRIT